MKLVDHIEDALLSLLEETTLRGTEYTVRLPWEALWELELDGVSAYGSMSADIRLAGITLHLVPGDPDDPPSSWVH